MKRTTLAVVLLAVLIATPTVTLAVVRGSPDLAVSSSDDRFTAGEEAAVTVTLTNSGELDKGSASSPSLNSEVTTARGVNVELEANGAPVTVKTGEKRLGQLAEGGSADLPFTLVVEQDADPGTYDLEAVVEYTYYSTVAEDSGARNDQTTIERFDVTIDVIDRARFAVVDAETDVRVGSSGTVDVTMRNVGTEAATDAEVRLESLNDALTFGGSATGTRFVDDWQPGETETVSYRVTAGEDARTQQYAFRASTAFDDGDGIARESDSLSLGVQPLPEVAFELRNVSDSLRVGQEGTLRGTLVNTGDTATQDVVLRFASETDRYTPGSTEYSVGTLDAGEGVPFEFNVEVAESAESGPRQFAFRAEYRDADGDARTSDDLLRELQVAPRADTFDVMVRSGNVTNGQGGTLDVTVTNQANETLTAISAELFADSPISVTDDSGYIDELAPGESAELTFGIAASGAMSKDYSATLEFQYDEDGETKLSDSYRIPVSVQERQNGGGNTPLLLVGLGVVALIAVGAFMRFR